MASQIPSAETVPHSFSTGYPPTSTSHISFFKPASHQEFTTEKASKLELLAAFVMAKLKVVPITYLYFEAIKI